MKVGVLAQRDYLNNGLQTFEKNICEWLIDQDGFNPIYYSLNNSYPLSRTFQSVKLRDKVKEKAEIFDRVFVPAQNRLRFDPEEISAEVVPYVHDVFPYVSDYSSSRDRFLRPIIQALRNKWSVEYMPHLASCSKVFAASESSARDLRQRTAFNGDIHVVYQGVDDMPDLQWENQQRDIDLLYVGELFERKNPGMIRETLRKAEEEGYSVATVNFNGHDSLPGKSFENVSDRELAEIYSSSRYLLHASYMEGFGRCPVEAQKYGCIPLALDTPINREVLGDSGMASWVQISSADEVLEHLPRKITKEYRDIPRKNAERFKWQDCREKIKEVLLEG